MQEVFVQVKFYVIVFEFFQSWLKGSLTNLKLLNRAPPSATNVIIGLKRCDSFLKGTKAGAPSVFQPQITHLLKCLHYWQSVWVFLSAHPPSLKNLESPHLAQLSNLFFAFLSQRVPFAVHFHLTKPKTLRYRALVMRRLRV